jgi:DsbC/DsbD-like thiol-disulfide interchange protein
MQGRFRHTVLAAILALAAAAPGQAQLRRIKAELTPRVETTPVRAGSQVRLSLRVLLPADVHVQSDKPRDPLLIPTALTLTPPAGVAVATITYPKATDLAQAGQEQPLAVFGHDFTIGITVKLAANLAPGVLTLPGALRYQPCDDKMCFPPNRVETSWTLDVAR